MSSSARARIIHAATSSEDVFVVGKSVMAAPGRPAAVVTAAELVAAAEARAAEIVAAAEQQAAVMVAEATASVNAVRGQAHAEGFEAGRAQGIAELQAHVDLARQAASEGAAIRDGVAAQSLEQIARIVAVATRQVVAGAYRDDPATTVAAVQDAVRTASGHDLLAIRVAPGAVELVRAALADIADYVRPDAAISLGGCIIDLQNGSIDATLDTRLDLMEVTLRRDAGEAMV